MAPGLKLYGAWVSPPTMAAALTLLELDVDFEFVQVELFKGEHKQPAYLAKNPFAFVPFLEDGDVKLFESGAIIRYLADTYSREEPALYGRTLAERAAVNQWLEAGVHNLGPPVAALVMQSVFSRPLEETLVQQRLKELEQVLDVYEARLAESTYLAGNFVSLADFAPVPAFFHLVEHCPPVAQLMEDRPHLKAWWDDITSRPTWQKIAKECTAAVTMMKQRRVQQNA